MKELIKINIGEAVCPMMKKLDEFLACQRKKRKTAPKRQSVKDLIWITRTRNDLFKDDLAETHAKNRNIIYLRNKFKHLREGDFKPQKG